jgi:hypothetical protein
MTAVDRLGFHLRLKSGDRVYGRRVGFLQEVKSRDAALGCIGGDGPARAISRDGLNYGHRLSHGTRYHPSIPEVLYMGRVTPSPEVEIGKAGAVHERV